VLGLRIKPPEFRRPQRTHGSVITHHSAVQTAVHTTHCDP
jgi:hypothetical protein